MIPNAVETKNLCKSYPGFALKNVSLVVPTGSIVGFVGENGAGKTTTLKAILGLVRADSGSVRLLGAAPDEVKSRVGVVFEDAYFYEKLCPENIDRIMAGIHPGWDGALFAGYCRRFDLDPKKKLRDFSRGMRMKLSLATALAHRPELLILDEATSGLDPVVRGEMLELFQDFIQDENHSILMSSHITGDLEKVADYIAFLHGGELLFQTEKDVLLERYAVLRCPAQMLAALPPELIAARGKAAMGAEVLVTEPARVRALLPDAVCDAASIDDIMMFLARRETA